MLLNRKNPHGGDIYHNKVRLDFSANINPAGMPDAVRNALRDAALSCTAYPDPYCTALREKLAGAERVPEGWILCGNGAAELIYQFAYALPRSKPVLIVSPAFCEYGQALQAAGIGAAHYLMREEDGFRLTDTFLRTDFSGYGAVILCSPNNPTGICIEPALLHELLARGVRVFCDLCFLDLTDQPERYDIPALLKAFPNLVILRAFTKSYAMAGVRLGYALCSDPVFLEKMAEKVPCWNVSTLAQQAGIAALGCRDWLRESVVRISAERERMMRILSGLGLHVFPGEANFLLVYAENSLPEALMSRGIMVRDCTGYVGLHRGYFRVAVRTRAENDQLLAGIQEILHACK